MPKKPVVSSRGKIFSMYGASRGPEFPLYLFYLFKTYLVKPKVTINFSLESGETEFSFPYFFLTIKTAYKEIGNIEISMVGNFYDMNEKKMITIPFVFQDPPEVLESADTATLTSKPELDFSNYLHERSQIKLTVNYDYMLFGEVRTASSHSNWRFDPATTEPSLISVNNSK